MAQYFYQKLCEAWLRRGIHLACQRNTENVSELIIEMAVTKPIDNEG